MMTRSEGVLQLVLLLCCCSPKCAAAVCKSLKSFVLQLVLLLVLERAAALCKSLKSLVLLLCHGVLLCPPYTTYREGAPDGGSPSNSEKPLGSAQQ